MCFYRRNEIPGHLVSHADKHHWGESEPAADADIVDSDDEDAARDAAERAERALLKEREVFLSRQVHTHTSVQREKASEHLSHPNRKSCSSNGTLNLINRRLRTEGVVPGGVGWGLSPRTQYFRIQASAWKYQSNNTDQIDFFYKNRMIYPRTFWKSRCQAIALTGVQRG